MTGPVAAEATCPSCGAAHEHAAAFCEACGAPLGADPRDAADPGVRLLTAATPRTASAGDESPLDVGWTGAVAGGPPATAGDGGAGTCPVCRLGAFVDGYCDQCGSPAPDPRSHYVENPASWVGGVCDVGREHWRNEDAMAISAEPTAGSRAVLVVCDGVSSSTDSHIASLAAARAALTVLDEPLPRGAGTAQSWEAGARHALGSAVEEANQAVVAAVPTVSPNPAACTFAAAVTEGSVIVAGTVGDSRVYWLPDDPATDPVQLGRDDSWAAEQMALGVERREAESGPGGHTITRWLGSDAPEDLTPHLGTVHVVGSGWLLVCSDGLWNYCSEPRALRELLRSTAGATAGAPVDVAQELVDFANEQGGRDNITVALARFAGQGSQDAAPAAMTPNTRRAGIPGATHEGDPIDG